MVKWDLVCSDVKGGWLGIKNLKHFNVALLGKCLWRFLVDRLGMWRSAVICKYGVGSHKWFPNAIDSPYGSGFWKGILRGWEAFVRHIRFDIGDGSSVRFWKDKWCGDRELWRAFPTLFSLALEEDSLVSSILQVLEDRVVLNPIFWRHLQDWELDSCLLFFKQIYSQHVRGDSLDKVRWEGGKGAIFSIS